MSENDKFSFYEGKMEKVEKTHFLFRKLKFFFLLFALKCKFEETRWQFSRRLNETH